MLNTYPHKYVVQPCDVENQVYVLGISVRFFVKYSEQTQYIDVCPVIGARDICDEFQNV